MSVQIAGRELSDDEFFGGAAKPAVLSDEEFMGAPKPQVLSDAEFFAEPQGLGQAMLNAFPAGAVRSAVATPLKGISALESGSDRLAKVFDAIDMGEPAPPTRGLPNIETQMAQAYAASPPERRAQMRATLAQPQAPVVERPGFRAGQAVEGFTNETFPVSPENEQRLPVQVMGGLGSVVGSAATRLVPGVGPVLAGASLMAGAAGEQADEAVRSGATPEQIGAAVPQGSLAGLGDVASLEILFRRGPKLPGAIGVLKTIGTKMLQGGATEGSTEGLQKAWQNLVAKYNYDPSKEILEGAGNDALVGAIVGVITGGLGGGLQTFAQREQPVAPEQIEPTLESAPEAAPAPPVDPFAAGPAGRVEPTLDPNVSRETMPPAPEPDPLADADAVLARMRQDALAVAESEDEPSLVLGRRRRAEAEAAAAAQGLPAIGATVAVDAEDGIVETGKIGRYWQDDTGAVGMDIVDDDNNPVAGGYSSTLNPRAVEGDGTRADPVVVRSAQDIAAANVQVADPTPAQAEAGNAKKAHLTFPEGSPLKGLEIAIETPKGGTRTDTKGRWSVPNFPASYGYIKRTEDATGEQIDVYIGDDPAAPKVWVIDQIDPKTKNFDEYKAVLGVSSEAEARAIYTAAFSDTSGPSRIGAVTEMSAEQFKSWVKNGDTKKPLAYVKPKRSPLASRPAPEMDDRAHGAPRKLLRRALAKAGIDPGRVGMTGDKRMSTATIARQTAEEAQAIQAAVVREQQISTNRSEAARKRAPPGKMDLLQFLASRGGIRDDGSGELADLRGKFIPGFGMLVRPNGRLTQDGAREAATEAGYIGRNDAESGNQGSDINDLLNALDDSVRGKRIFRRGADQAEYDQERQARSQRNEMEKEAGNLGVDTDGMSDEQLNAALSDLLAKAANLPTNPPPAQTDARTRKDMGPGDFYDAVRALAGYVMDQRQMERSYVRGETVAMAAADQYDMMNDTDVADRMGDNLEAAVDEAVDESEYTTTEGRSDEDQDISFDFGPASQVAPQRQPEAPVGPDDRGPEAIAGNEGEARQGAQDAERGGQAARDGAVEQRRPVIERTEIGDQYVVPGAEARQAAPKLAVPANTEHMGDNEILKRALKSVGIDPARVTMSGKTTSMRMAKIANQTEAEAVAINDAMAVEEAAAAKKKGKSPLASRGRRVIQTDIEDLTGKPGEPTMLNVAAPPQPSKPTDAKITDLADTIERLIRRLSPTTDAELFVDAALDEDGTTGQAMPRIDLIRIALLADDAVGVTRHEAVHILRRRGFISEAEWKALEPHFQAWRRKFDIERRYAKRMLTEDMKNEEAVAEAFRHWEHGNTDIDWSSAGAREIVVKLFRRLRLLLQRIAAAMRARGIDDVSGLFKAIESGEVGKRERDVPLGDRLTKELVDWHDMVRQIMPGVDPDALHKGVRASLEATMANIPRAPGGLARGRIEIALPKHMQGPRVSALRRQGFTPLQGSVNVPEFQNLIKRGITGEQNIERWLGAFRGEWDDIVGGVERGEGRVVKSRDALTESQFAQLGSLLMDGDARAIVWTRKELHEQAFNDKVITAYLKTRRLLEKIGRLIDQHRRAIVEGGRVQAEKMGLLARAAEMRGVAKDKFVALAATRSALIRRLQRGALGTYATALQRRIETVEAKMMGTTAKASAEYDALLDRIDVLDATLAQSSVRRHVGYFPHKFFGSWRVFEQTGKDAKGNPVWTHIAGKHGFFDDRHAAVLAAKTRFSENSDAVLRVEPVQFRFPGENATLLKDASYWKMMNDVSKEFGVEGQELKDLMKGIVRRRAGHRSPGFLKARQGVEGFSKDLDRVMRAHMAEAVRYVELDKIKYRYVRLSERMNLDRGSQLYKMMESWFNAVNGNPSPSEQWMDQVLEKNWGWGKGEFWAEPAWKGAIAASATATPFFLSAAFGSGGFMMPFVGVGWGAYVGYRIYKAISTGGGFKTRALTSAITADMAQLKLGLFLNVFSPLANLSQLILNSYPKLGEKYFPLALKLATSAMLSKVTGKPNATWRLLEREGMGDVLGAATGHEHQWDKPSKWRGYGLLAFTTAEKVNRAVTFLGGYKRALDQGKDHGAAVRAGRDLVSETQFHPGLANIPEILRSPAGRVMGQFKNFVIQQLTFVLNLRGAEIPRFLFSMFLVAGALGLPPFALDWLIELLTGHSPVRMLNNLLLEKIAEGGAAATAFTLLLKGLPGLLFGVDMQSRVGMGPGFVMGDPKYGLQQVAGPFGGSVAQSYDLGKERPSAGDMLRTVSPAIGNPVKMLEALAAGMPIDRTPPGEFVERVGEGLRGEGKIVQTNPWKGNKTEIELTKGEALLSALGGRPMKATLAADFQKSENERRAREAEARKPYMTRITEAERRFSKPDQEDIRNAAIDEIEAEAEAAGITISKQSSRNASKNAGLDRVERIIERLPKKNPSPLARKQREIGQALGRPAAP